MPSRAATISGRFGAKNGIVTHGELGETMDLSVPTLPLLLREKGVKTACVSTFGRHPSPWFYVGWENYFDPTGWHFQATPAWKVNEHALDFLEKNADEDFFLWVQYWDVHAVYDPPQSCVDAVKNDEYPAYPTEAQLESFQSDKFWHCARMMGIQTYEDYKNVVDLYDGEIRYADAHIGKILAKLEQLGILDDTLIIVSADHGEELGEHGVFVEHWSTYDGTNKVPLILRYPEKIKAGTVREDLVYQMDWSATVLDFFGAEIPQEWDAKPLFDGNKRESLIIGHGLYTSQRTVVTNDYKLMHTLHPGQWDLPEYQLFDRNNDPFEQHAIQDENPEVVRSLREILEAWERTHIKGSDPTKMNAQEGPPGFRLYGQVTLTQFLNEGIAMATVMDTRKPEVE